jgi:hypothetical protein
LRSDHQHVEKSATFTQHASYINEKEKILKTKTKLKLMEHSVENKIELTRTQAQHRINLRQVMRSQAARETKRSRHWSVILGRDVSDKTSSSMATSISSSVQGNSAIASRNISKTSSRRASNGKISEKMQEFQASDASKIMDDQYTDEDAADMALMNSSELEKQQEIAKKQIQELTANLRTFQQDIERAKADLQIKHSTELQAKEKESQNAMMVIAYVTLTGLGNGVETRHRYKGLEQVFRGGAFGASNGPETRARDGGSYA